MTCAPCCSYVIKELIDTEKTYTAELSDILQVMFCERSLVILSVIVAVWHTLNKLVLEMCSDAREHNVDCEVGRVSILYWIQLTVL